MRTLFLKQEIQQVSVPSLVDNSEKIIRALYHPSQINKNTGNIKASFFYPPAEKDGSSGLSVIRLNFSSLNKSKFHCKRSESSSKEFYGFVMLYASEIRAVNFETWVSNVLSTPINDLPYPFGEHADIFYYSEGIVYVKKHEPLPTSLKAAIEQMKGSFKVFMDSDPKHQDWRGDDIASLSQ